LEEFVAVVREDSEEAKGLAKETFEDIMNVLDEKAEKAKKLKDKVKDEVGKGKK
jgi:thioredoxin-like negative regulator of GroEL